MIDYFWNLVFESLMCAMLCFAILAIAIALINYSEKWFAARKHILKYENGYKKAINDAISDINRMYAEYESDDPLADIPCQKTIIARLERLKYVNKRNIPEQ